MSEENYIDVDFLISLVHERPIIWDKEDEFHSDRLRKSNEWVAVCRNLFEDYNDFDRPKKKKIGNEVLKKWRSVKDNFFRYVKKVKENNSIGSDGRKTKRYHYYNQLLFLLKADPSNESDSSMDKEPETTKAPVYSPPPVREMPSLPPGPSRKVPINRKRPKKAIDNFEVQVLEALKEKQNRHLSFFKGILPSLSDFTEIQTLAFQSRVIQIITEMKMGEQAQATTWQSRGYVTGIKVESPSPSTSGYQPAEYNDDSHEEKYNIT